MRKKTPEYETGNITVHLATIPSVYAYIVACGHVAFISEDAHKRFKTTEATRESHLKTCVLKAGPLAPLRGWMQQATGQKLFVVTGVTAAALQQKLIDVDGGDFVASSVHVDA